jgi:predicted ribonuclease YlaK
LLLTATVLGELDHLKVAHQNPEFRQKIESLIRRIKGYRGRGKLTVGEVLRKDVSTIRSMAVEPKVGNSLPWLDPTNNDDRLLAAFVEVMRQHPRTPVVLVTRDINLQNKAEYAGLPYVEPPDPSS